MLKFFADHTFLIALFYEGRSKDESKLHKKAKDKLRELKSIYGPFRITTTNLELSRVITKIFKDSKKNFKLTRAVLDRFFNSKIFKYEIINDDVFKKSIALFRSKDYRLYAEFLDITSFIFHTDIKKEFLGVLAYHKHFNQASNIFGFTLLT